MVLLLIANDGDGSPKPCIMNVCLDQQNKKKRSECSHVMMTYKVKAKARQGSMALIDLTLSYCCLHVKLSLGKIVLQCHQCVSVCD